MTADKQICKQCGRIHVAYDGKASCSAHKRGTDPLEPCGKHPRSGQGVCRNHGGNIPKALEKAQERLAMMSAQGEIADLMRECDIPDQHPIDGLLEVVRVSGAMMRLLTVKVGELKEDPEVNEVLVEKGEDLSTKRVAEDDAFWGLNYNGEMAPHLYVKLLEVWTSRYERACKTALDAGIEERRIRLAEDTVETFVTALSKAVVVAGLDPAVRAALNTALAAELRKGQTVMGQLA